ncbi:MAG TPA: phenylalanine--tRNA ligase subunit alpha [Acidimicrobiales bacterium]|nr:phenylalanine--tRNA ligase subunit alpha [Acidimicrobiales bacterium]
MSATTGAGPPDRWADVVADALARIGDAADLAALAPLDVELLGRHSEVVAARSTLASLPAEQRRDAGRALNQARAAIEEAMAARRRTLEEVQRAAQLESERIDLTEVRPARRRGHLHLVTQARDRLEDVFVGMGYHVADGPEAETDWYNFEALNFPAGHPARNMYDTLYLELGPPESVLLRTHTSPVQIRVMEASRPPIYAVMPGRCYRQDTADASHLPNFHQIEGLVVDRGISFADLAGTLDAFTEAYFGPGFRSRLRPSYFPFTEPSAEFDITCVFCRGEGCRSCGRTGWLELGGCGMVHPNVFRAVGYDPEEWTGFAFGFGIDRMTAQRHGIDDLRELVTNDVRFLQQF